MDARSDALSRIVELATAHGLTASDIARALPGPTAPATTTSGRMLAWVGALFILCGLGFFIDSWWDAMNAASRIILYLGTGLVVLVLNLVFIRKGLYTGIEAPLFLLAALLQTVGILVAFDELGTGGDIRHALLATNVTMLAQTLLVFRVHRLGVLVFIALCFALGALIYLLDILGVDEEANMALSGLGLLAAAWALDRGDYANSTPFWYFVGGIMASYGVFEVVESSPLQLFYAGYAALLIYLSTLARSRVLLGVGSCAMIGYLTWFTNEYFVDSIGWPVSLMLIGAALVGLSVFALHLGKGWAENQGRAE